MIRTALGWLWSNFPNILAIVLSGALLAYGVMIFKERMSLENRQFENGIQNHLVWSIKGECFFTKPTYTETVYLVRVTDCDRSK